MQILHYFLGNCFLEKESTVLPASHIVACDFMMGCRPLFESLIMTYPTTFATTYPIFDVLRVDVTQLPLALPYSPSKPKIPPIDLEALYETLDQAESLVFLDTESTSGGDATRLTSSAEFPIQCEALGGDGQRAEL